MCVAYNPKDRDSEAYRVEWIEIGYHDPSHPGKWEKLHREEGGSHVQERSLTLPPSPERVKRDLQVAVKYICCPDVIFSDSWTVEQPGLCEYHDCSLHPQNPNIGTAFAVHYNASGL